MMLATAAASAAWLTSTSRPLALRARSISRTPPCFMPEGPECLVHAERLNERFAGMTLRRVAILSGRYAGDGTIPGRSAPPAHWDTLRQSLPAAVEYVGSK